MRRPKASGPQLGAALSAALMTIGLAALIVVNVVKQLPLASGRLLPRQRLSPPPRARPGRTAITRDGQAAGLAQGALGLQAHQRRRRASSQVFDMNFQDFSASSQGLSLINILP